MRAALILISLYFGWAAYVYGPPEFRQAFLGLALIVALRPGSRGGLVKGPKKA